MALDCSGVSHGSSNGIALAELEDKALDQGRREGSWIGPSAEIPEIGAEVLEESESGRLISFSKMQTNKQTGSKIFYISDMYDIYHVVKSASIYTIDVPSHFFICHISDFSSWMEKD